MQSQSKKIPGLPPKCILFAGAVGSSKTPIATYLSYNLNLPIFSNDAIRSEVAEDNTSSRLDEYIKRRDERIKYIIENKIDFIYDASIDREWSRLKQILIENGYKWFVVSIDLSKEFLIKIYEFKKYDIVLDNIDKYIKDHEEFLTNFKDDVDVRISEKDFSNRLRIALNQAKKFIK